MRPVLFVRNCTVAGCIALTLVGCAASKVEGPLLDLQKSIDERRNEDKKRNDVVKKGLRLVKDGKWAAAEAILDAVTGDSPSKYQYGSFYPEIISAYVGLAKARANLGKCDAAAYSLNSAIKIELINHWSPRDADSRTSLARSYIEQTPNCTLENGNTLRDDAEQFLTSKLPAVAEGEIVRRQAERAAQAVLERHQAEYEASEEETRMQSAKRRKEVFTALTQAISTMQPARSSAPQPSAGAIVSAPNSSQSAEQEHQSRTRASAAQPPMPASKSNQPSLTSPEPTQSTASQIHSGNARDMTSGNAARDKVSTNGGKTFLREETQCAQFQLTERKSSAQWFKFTNQCGFPIFVQYKDANASFRMRLRAGQTDSSWFLVGSISEMQYWACREKGPNGEYVNIDKENRCYFVAR